MKQVKFNRLAVALTAVMVSGAAWADTTTVGVSAAITSQCAVGQTADIGFGNLSMLTGLAASTTDSVAAGSMKAICTNGSGSPTFTFSSANGSGTDFRLIGSTDATVFIKYSLHPDTSGAASAFSHSVAAAYPGFSPDGTLKSLDLAGKILAAEKAGKKIQAYTDTITVTTSF